MIKNLLQLNDLSAQTPDRNGDRAHTLELILTSSLSLHPNVPNLLQLSTLLKTIFGRFRRLPGVLSME